MTTNNGFEDRMAGGFGRHEALGNGRYVVLLSEAGGGMSSLGETALTRWHGDRLRDHEGFFVYVRDVAGGTRWSAGYQPVRRPPEQYRASVCGRVFEIGRRDGAIETTMEVCVLPEDDVELRRITLANHSEQHRRIELTSYAELVLNDLGADLAHPAFSRLFVQTHFEPTTGALIAHRRPRSPGEQVTWAFHRLTGGSSDDPVTFETDRARFLGRCRSTTDPQALSHGCTLSGTVGNVLDPVFSLRREVTVPPGGTASVTFALGAAYDRTTVLDLAQRYGDAARVAAAFELARAGSKTVVLLDVPPTRPITGRYVPAAFTPGHDGEEDAATEPLLMDNGYGGFSAAGKEYVIRIRPDSGGGWHRPPMAWTNVLANEALGCLVTDSGLDCTWAANSREDRLTPWSNDALAGPVEDTLYVRDEQAGVFWSPLPGPAPAHTPYEVRHGMGYTRCHCRYLDLDQEVTIFVPRRDPVRVVRLRLVNRSDATRELSLFSYTRLAMGASAAAAAHRIETAHDAVSGVLTARNPRRERYRRRLAFSSIASERPFLGQSWTTEREAFIGSFRSTADPAALRSDESLNGVLGTPHQACFARQLAIKLEPGEVFTCAFVLGEVGDLAAAREVAARFTSMETIETALQAVDDFWEDTCASIQMVTPYPEIDLMVNGWLPYQNLSCRLWGRTALYQSGGAFGFRDQLQDAAALRHLLPGLTKAQILRHAAHQFAEGDVLHWWHPPSGRGIRTRFSDDLLWLPFLTASYVASTGDVGLLDKEVRFLEARSLPPGEDEIFVEPVDTGTTGSIYEHCCRAIDRSLTRGAHGLPLIGVGDWNDGMNRVGRQGRGESVWLGFFLYAILQDFIPLCASRGDDERAARYRAYQHQLHEALNDGGWDGGWYRRAYYDDGTPLGSAESDECRIDALAQAWAVLSGVAPPERAEKALDALEEHLVSEEDGIIRLLTPPFDTTTHDPGYIKGYLPGVRENGGQYTHAALWAVQALARAGRNDIAARLLRMLSPAWHARDGVAADVYKVEPYVIAADVYGEPPHVGRGGWTWYTGSAGWMYRVAVETIMGLTVEDGTTLVLDPRLPSVWPVCSLRYRLPGEATTYEITYHNPDGVAGHVGCATLDGEEAEVADGIARVPLVHDGSTHRVVCTMVEA